MATISNRLPIGNALVSLVAGILDPATNQPIYPLTKLGAVLDPGANALWAQVTHFQGQAKPVGSGGNLVGWRRDDEIIYLITSGFGPYDTNDSTAEQTMLYTMDVVLPALEAHFQLPQSGNPSLAVPTVYSVLPIMPDRSIVVPGFPNGHSYKLWHLPVIVKQQYSVTLVQP